MKRGTDLKLKFKALRAHFGLAAWEAKGLLQALWDFTAENAMCGDIGRFTDEEIAIGVEWERTDAAEFVAALVKTKWLDRSDEHRLVIHDWHEHCEEWIKKRVHRAKLKFASEKANFTNTATPDGGQSSAIVMETADNGGQRPEASDNGSLPVPVPVPVPSQSNLKKVARVRDVVQSSTGMPDTLARLLADRIREHKPDFLEPDIGRWTYEFRDMIGSDGRTPTRITAVIKWATADRKFWQATVMDAETLRKNFDKIEAKMREEETNASEGGNRKPERGKSSTPRPGVEPDRYERSAAEAVASGRVIIGAAAKLQVG